LYARDDLRSTLKPSAAAPGNAAFKGSAFGRFYEEPATESGPEGDAWYIRGQNLVVAYTRARAGGIFVRRNHPDEWGILLPRAGMTIEVTAGGETRTAEGPAVVFVPPGDSAVIAKTDGVMIRLATTRAKDLAGKCPNHGDYGEPDPHVPPLEDWPAPVGGFKIRVYSGTTPPTPGRFGRLYRCTTLMVNFGSGRNGARDVHKMSPHHHDDFEQYSIGIEGTYVHHLRWPWTTDMTHWRADEHALCATPSVAVIPPPAIHTSQSMDDGLNQLIDAFCPPRRDFSSKPGWVLNAADYPEPADLVMSDKPIGE
jgi:hypothetical protein